MNELTREQLNQQDFVDNAIHALLIDLNGQEIHWDIGKIATIRDAVDDVLPKGLDYA